MCPDVSKDENVFDIQQGVGISLLVAKPSRRKTVRHSDLWGSRQSKYENLLGATCYTSNTTELCPDDPQFFFVPKDFSTASEYLEWPSLLAVFTRNGPGVKTERDRVSIHWTRYEIADAVGSFRPTG